MVDRIHPESMNTLRQLVKLHGKDSLIQAVHDIAKENPKPFSEATDEQVQACAKSAGMDYNPTYAAMIEWKRIGQHSRTMLIQGLADLNYFSFVVKGEMTLPSRKKVLNNG